jgi:hypothetical protein
LVLRGIDTAFDAAKSRRFYYAAPYSVNETAVFDAKICINRRILRIPRLWPGQLTYSVGSAIPAVSNPVRRNLQASHDPQASPSVLA